MKYSLREFLIVVAFIVVGCAALMNATDGWWGVVGTVATCLVMAQAIMAIFDRGGRQIFAVGFLICSVTYFGIVHVQKRENGTNYEYFTAGVGKLPSTKLLTAWHRAVASESVDPTTGNKTKLPDGGSFMRIGHALVMLMLGYLGGHFARYVYIRRIREADAPQS